MRCSAASHDLVGIGKAGEFGELVGVGGIFPAVAPRVAAFARLAGAAGQLFRRLTAMRVLCAVAVQEVLSVDIVGAEAFFKVLGADVGFMFTAKQRGIWPHVAGLCLIIARHRRRWLGHVRYL